MVTPMKWKSESDYFKTLSNIIIVVSRLGSVDGCALFLPLRLIKSFLMPQYS